MDIILEAYIESITCYPYVTAAMRAAAGTLDPAATTDGAIRSCFICREQEGAKLLKTLRLKNGRFDGWLLDALAAEFESLADTALDPLCSVAAIDPQRDSTEPTSRRSRDSLLAGKITAKDDCMRWAAALRALRTRTPDRLTD